MTTWTHPWFHSLGSLIWFFDMTIVCGRTVFVSTNETGQSPEQSSYAECFADGPAVHLQSSVSGASRAHNEHPMVQKPISLPLMFTRRSPKISVRTTESTSHLPYSCNHHCFSYILSSPLSTPSSPPSKQPHSPHYQPISPIPTQLCSHYP